MVSEINNNSLPTRGEGGHNQSLECNLSLIQRAISRRRVLAGLLGSASIVGLGYAARTGEAAQIPAVDADWMQMIQVAQNNSKNQAVVFRRGKGAVVTFGDSLFHLDLSTAQFNLFTNDTLVFTGSSTETFTGRPDAFLTGEIFTQVVTVKDVRPSGTAFRAIISVERIDESACNFQINVDVGVLGQVPTFWFSTIYNYCTDFFPHGFQISGDLSIPNLPVPDFNSLEFAAHLFSRELNIRAFTNLEVMSATEPVIALDGGTTGGGSTPPQPPPQPKCSTAKEVGLAVAGAALGAATVVLGLFGFFFAGAVTGAASIEATSKFIDCLN